MRAALALALALAVAGCAGGAAPTARNELNLPDDLRAFLHEGEQLDYDVSQAEAGRLVLKPLEELRLRAVYVETDEEGHALGEHEETDFASDPHAGENGYYDVPAVDLVDSVSGDHPATGLIVWLPKLGMFGTWDSSHFDLLVFPGVKWEGIAADPLRYVNAQWSDSPPGYYLAPWLHDIPWREGRPAS